MSKYHSVKITYDGITFDSKKEYFRYLELKALEKGRVISDLRMQVKHTLIPPQRDENGKHIFPVYYYADFEYVQDGKKVVEDVKGFKTKDYIIKKKLLLYNEGITIREV